MPTGPARVCILGPRRRVAPVVFAGALLAAAFGLCALPAVVHADGKAMAKIRVKMAFVDLERCVGETEDGLRAKAALKKLSDHKQMAIVPIEESLKVEQDELTKLAQTQAPDLAARAIAHQNKLQSYQDMLKKLNSELAQREEELFAPIERKLHDILGRIGQAEGYDLIVDKKAISMGRTDLDMTERVIREYNWGVGPVPSTPNAAAPVVTKPPTGGGPPQRP